MRKWAVWLLIGVVLFAFGYSAAWYYGASRIKTGISDYATTLKQRKDAPDFSYQSIEVGGFPGIYHIVINKPLLAEKGKTGQGFSTEKLLLTADLWHNTYTVLPVGKLIVDTGEVEARKQFQVEYAKEPLIAFQLKSLASWRKFNDNSGFADEIQLFRYKDEGFKLVDTGSEGVIVHTSPALVEMRILESDGPNYHSNIILALQGIDFNEEYRNMLHIPGTLQAKVSIGFEGTKTAENSANSNKGIGGSDFEAAEITVHECDIQGGDIGVSLRGRVNASVRRFMPEGELSLQINHMPKLLDYLLFIQAISDKEKAMAAFTQMAEVPEANDATSENMHFVVKGSMTGITIGKLDMSQVVLLFRTFL